MAFRRLPLLDILAHRQSPEIERKLSRTVVVAVQHLLETTGSLFETLLRLGLRPEHAFVLGKVYSSNRNVADRLRACGVTVDAGSMPAGPGRFQEAFRCDVDRLWSRALETVRTADCTDLVVLDDGGRCISTVPEQVYGLARVSGVEQTTGGLPGDRNPPGFRVIEVATSAAKRVFESPMISRAVLKRLPPLDARARCGVVGVGNIGGSIVSHLLTLGREVLAFDRNATRAEAFPAAQWVDSLTQVMCDSDVVFGCTGEDLFADAPKMEWHSGQTTLVSCSSEDREFRSLLAAAAASRSLERWTPIGVAELRIGAARVRILRGGFPLNFDGSAESVPASEIQLTRTLLLGGVLQAALCGRGNETEARGGCMLDPRFQLWAAREWTRIEPENGAASSLELADDSMSEERIARRSGGAIEDTSPLRSALDLQ